MCGWMDGFVVYEIVYIVIRGFGLYDICCVLFVFVDGFV